jgi:acetyl/propionyl-CoA carboxylase alpha subunit
VEHPVTEAVTGVDLVQAMIRVAAGEKLPFGQSDVTLSGHALEARIYAEDPARGFLPSPGRLTAFRPPEGAGLRIDAGVEAGSEVSVHYDALLAKLIAHAPTREEAIGKLDAGLRAFAVAGVRTSIPFQRWLLRQPEFRAGAVDVGFVERRWPKGGAPPLPSLRAPAEAAARAALAGAPSPDQRAAVTVRPKLVDVLIDGELFSFARDELGA